MSFFAYEMPWLNEEFKPFLMQRIEQCWPGPDARLKAGNTELRFTDAPRESASALSSIMNKVIGGLS